MLLRNAPKPCTPKGQVFGCVEDFAPLPAVAMRGIDMVSDAETSAVDLEPVLQGDISIVAATLKLANSAFNKRILLTDNLSGVCRITIVLFVLYWWS